MDTRIHLHLLAGVLTVLWFTVPALARETDGSDAAAATETFTLTIQQPGTGVLPTARVRISLVFDSSIPSSADPSYSVSVQHPGGTAESVVLNPPLAGTVASGTSGEGTVDFYRQSTSSPETAEIVVRPVGRLEDENCTFDDSNPSDISDDLTYVFTLTHPDANAIQGYRMTSYRALSSAACGTFHRRNTDVPGAILSWPGVSELGRHPFDVVLVLDKSGSMGGTVAAHGGSGGTTTKMAILQESAALFVTDWKVLAGGSEEDRLGVVFFNQGVDRVTPSTSFLVDRGSSGAAWNPFSSEIHARSHGGSTAMGDGMRKAFEELGVFGSDGPDHDRAVVVMTDGKQNSGNQVVLCATASSCGGDATVWALRENDASSSSDVSVLPLRESLVQTIFVGPAGAVPAELMNEIAEQNGGVMDQRYDPAETDFGFLEQLVETLKGSSPGFVLQERATLSPNESGRSHTFSVNATAEQIVLNVNWLALQRTRALAVDLIGPDGRPVRPDSAIHRRGYSVIPVDLTGMDAAGMWEARLRRNDLDGTVAYNLSVIAEDEVLATRAYFSRPRYWTGEDLTLHVMLREEDRPLTGIDGVRVRPHRPEEGLGNLLREQSARQRADLPEDVLADPYSTKLHLLYQNSDLRAQVEPRPRDWIQARDDGATSSGDREAGDGIYSVRIPSVETPGTYEFRVVIETETAELGPIQRIETAQTTVRVRPVLDASAASLTATGSGSALRLTPRDRFGNYLGPGYADQIVVRGAEGERLSSEVNDEEADGSYVVRLPDVAPTSDRPIRISMGGHEIAETTPADLLQGTIEDDCFNLGSSSGLILIGVLLGTGLVAVRRRRRAP